MDPELILLVTGVFLLAGFVKGVIGMGLPTVSVALLVLAVGVKQALALMLIPSIVTNIWQAAVGGRFLGLIRRLGLLFLAAAPAIWLGAGLLAKADALVLSAFFGAVLALYALLSLTGAHLPTPGRHETWLSPLVGAATGFITGLTGSFVVPAVMYMQALGLSRDELVQAMGIAFSLSTAMLAIALAGHALLPLDLGLLSASALVPSAIGMAVGQRVRKRLSEARFRQLFFSALLALGVWLMLRPAIL
ncbi:MAG: sulfite exporter TauE/SafE family protein [Alphaproteobacteria bacterium]|nr:MAG: sulfite exporter TauE/SafE family protein [Alphaproteobacteria bacterium]